MNGDTTMSRGIDLRRPCNHAVVHTHPYGTMPRGSSQPNGNGGVYNNGVSNSQCNTLNRPQHSADPSEYEEDRFGIGVLPMPDQHLGQHRTLPHNHTHQQPQDLLTSSPTQQMVGGGSNHGTLDRLGHLHNSNMSVPPNGGTFRNGLQLHNPSQQPPSESDSWLESSRSRETSPASSIPPGMPAFRVIPLCESESSGTHISDPFTVLGAPNGNPQQRGSSNLGSEPGSSNNTYGLFGQPTGPLSVVRAGSEANDTNATNGWGMSETDPLRGGSSQNGSVTNNGTAAAPLLRRNQYWV